MSTSLIVPMLFLIALVAVFYVLLTIVRAPKVWGVGANSDGSNPFAKYEPRMSANLSNQFEWPMFFYAICLLLIARPDFYQATYLWCAWLFVFGRVVHSCVQIFTSNIRLRGAIFTINFVAVMGMWLVLGLSLGFN